MRAAVFSEPGPAASVLRITDRDLPRVSAGEVRVRIVFSAVNPTDTGTRAGRGVPDGVSPPRVPHQDGAGVVDAIGEGVRGLEPGDRVWVWDAGYGRADGTAQEYVVLPRHQVVRMDDRIPLEVGAALGIPALTAHRCLTVAADGPQRLAPGALAGRTVLVAGGAGAVGNAAIQLAAWAGATVLTTVSSKEKAELASAAGAHRVINYREEDVRESIGGAAPNLIVEVSAANLELDLDVVAPGGNIAIYMGGTVSVPSFAAMVKNVSLDYVLTYTTTPGEKANAVAAVAEAVNGGAFRVGPEAGLPILRFPLERIAEAHEAVENHAVGKVIIEVTAL
ncbi:putative alcohol dehydrogenase [Actinoplanes missouriensis 431]|uniref:Putative alcohol dehydrogenase n=1 Tax=Actinoplanes missouriensis (strain ATCC 14538 / DSM 43046 / CBS 188.64 / JCM 3121 / NBRC 102363 / NCIMB 12654 / NRRL B-3342 / UNCC 431) TaxID=512565 RepID=I0GXZ8_ACTM4|nr:NADPH:quinone reductase [Actinoplanes missouriensis]BAL85635.1 putative alcohol dehydrogenase [Actinoplanes missouriensis 431]